MNSVQTPNPQAPAQGIALNLKPVPFAQPDPDNDDDYDPIDDLPWSPDDPTQDPTQQHPQPKKRKLGEFIEDHKDSIARLVIRSYPPIYQPTEPGQNQPLPELLRQPIGAQEHALRGTILSLKANQGTTIVGEMGTGKTFIGAASAYIAGFRSILVLCPPHLVRKWKREIEITVPDATAVIVQSITDMEDLRKIVHKGPLFTIMSRERAKLSYLWKPAVVVRPSISRDNWDEETGEPLRVIACPACYEQVVDTKGIPLSYKQINTKRTTCNTCQGPLWEADYTKRKRYPLADYAKLRMRQFFDLLICDEVHEYKGQGTAQGIAGAVLAGICGKSLVLTGTLMGGYSSTLFHLLYRFSHEVKSQFQHSDRKRWIDLYGFRQKNVKPGNSDDEPYEHGRGSRRKGYRTVEKETPGLAPAALFHLIGNSVFLRLHDVTNRLPPYDEQIMMNNMSQEDDPGHGISQQAAYEELYDDVRSAMVEALNRGSNRLMAVYLQALLSYPDACTHGETVIDPETHQLIASIPPLSPDRTYPKEQALIDLIAKEKAQGRRVLVYVTHTGVRDITGRMNEFLTREGHRTAVLKSNTTTKTEQREGWITQKVQDGLDVLICNPRLVQTGLDLVDFPTIVWFETDYSVYTMRQASRRSWRIGQTNPVKVIFMVYTKTLQSDALKLVAKKLQSSLAVEGDLPEDGLAAYGDDGKDLIMTLAKQIMGAESDTDTESVEALFARAREVESEGQEYLVDEEWTGPKDQTTQTDPKSNETPGFLPLAQPTPEPTPKPAPEPVPEPVPEPIPQPAPEPQGDQAAPTAQEPSAAPDPKKEELKQAILTWEQFMVEPDTPRKKSKKPPPAGASLFSWATDSIQK